MVEGAVKQDRLARRWSLVPMLACCLGLLDACSTPVQVMQNTPHNNFLSRSDIQEIRALVLRRSDIRKPLSRILADRPDEAWITTGRPGYGGEPFNVFTVAKRNGRWVVDSPIREERIVLP